MDILLDSLPAVMVVVVVVVGEPDACFLAPPTTTQVRFGSVTPANFICIELKEY